MVTELAPFVQFTPEALLGLFVVMLMFGYIVPLRIVRGRLADKDVVIKEQAQTILILKQNNAQLLMGNTATVQVLESTAEAVGGSNGDVV